MRLRHFRDTRGRLWQLELNAYTVRKIKQLTARQMADLCEQHAADQLAAQQMAKAAGEEFRPETGPPRHLDIAQQPGESITLLGRYQELFRDVLWILCQEQAAAGVVTPRRDTDGDGQPRYVETDDSGKRLEAKPIDQDEFLRSLSDDAIDEASKELLRGIVDFFPQRRRRAIAALLEKQFAAEDRKADHVAARVDDGSFDARLDREVQRAADEIDALCGLTPAAA